MWSFLVRVDIDRNSSKKCAEVQGPPRKGSKIVVSLFETLMFLSFISPHPMVMWCLNAVLLFQSIFLSTSCIHSYSNLWSPLLYERAQPSFKFVHKKHLTWYWCTPLTGFVLLARLSSQRHRCTLLVLSHCILSALHKVLVVGNIGCHRRKTCFHIFSTKCIVARLLSLAHCSWSALTTWCIVPGSTFSPSGHFRQLQHLRACWRGSGKPEHFAGNVSWGRTSSMGCRRRCRWSRKLEVRSRKISATSPLSVCFGSNCARVASRGASAAASHLSFWGPFLYEVVPHSQPSWCQPGQP